MIEQSVQPKRQIFMGLVTVIKIVPVGNVKCILMVSRNLF